jgi:NADPH-dependent 2,4-dienoyl-CoA reductase/sulfur reductase-like enzyme
MDLPHVFTLRTLADCRAIIARAASAKRAVVLGASFIGLEVAASLRARDIEVHVVARTSGRWSACWAADGRLRARPARGARRDLPLEDTPTAIDARSVKLKSGGTIDADLVVAGVGVRPRLALAEKAGPGDRPRSSASTSISRPAPGIFAAGDIARWPDPTAARRSGSSTGWCAQRQGRRPRSTCSAAGSGSTSVPFFWSQHYDVPINYVGHAEAWDEIAVDGDIAARDCAVRYKRGGRVLPWRRSIATSRAWRRKPRWT